MVRWTFRARAQQPMPTVAFVTSRSEHASLYAVAAFRKGLRETGYVEDRNAIVEYHWLTAKFDRLPALTAAVVWPSVAMPPLPSSRLRPKLRQLSRSATVINRTCVGDKSTSDGTVLGYPTIRGRIRLRRREFIGGI